MKPGWWMKVLLVAAAAATAGNGSAEEVKVLPLARARMLPVTSDQAAYALSEVLADLGFRLRVKQREDGLFITHGMGVGRLRKRGILVSPLRGAALWEVEVHAFVSPALEPAHVHVDAVLTTVEGPDGTRSHGYSLGEVESQILDALEERLGVAGRAIPEDLDPRRAAAAELRPTAQPCSPGERRFPVRIEASQVPPRVPAGRMRGNESGKVVVEARVLADGSSLPIQVLRGSGTPHSAELEEASMSVVALWRYRPARNGTCTIDAPMTVSVDFPAPQ